MARETPVRFGSGSQIYDFPLHAVENFSDNFRSVEPETVRLPGMNGGFSEYGLEQPPAKIGQVKITLQLDTEDPDEMTALRDEIGALRTFGLKPLYMQPSDPTLSVRWCYAYAQDSTMQKKPSQHTDLFQPVQLTFHVPDPTWYSTGTEPPAWGAFTWGAATWGGSVPTWAISGVSNDQIISITGSAIVQPRIVISCGVGETCENPTIQRIVNGVAVDEVSYTGVLTAGDVLEINARANSITLNSVDAYSSAFDFTHPAWFRLYPGTNTIRILFDNAGDDASIQVFYNEGYY